MSGLNAAIHLNKQLRLLGTVIVSLGRSKRDLDVISICSSPPSRYRHPTTWLQRK